MSIYEKVDFLMYELQNGFRMALKPFNPPPPLPPLGGGGGEPKKYTSLSFLFSLVRDAHHPSPSLTIPHHPSPSLIPQFSGFLGVK